jgi:hypothetical protein
MMLEAMLEASDPASCFKVYFTKNAANTKDSTQTIRVPQHTYVHKISRARAQIKTDK